MILIFRGMTARFRSMRPDGRGAMTTPAPMQSIMPGFHQGGTLIWRDGERISHERFIGQVLKLAEALPAAPHAILLCEDRYPFILALCACLIRGMRCLLPTDRLAQTIGELTTCYPGALCLTDTPIPDFDQPLWWVTVPEARDAECSEVPLIPADQDCVIAFTSGSTGKPQPHPKRWGDMMLTARIAARRFGLLPESSIITTVAAQHMYGLELSVMVPLATGVATYSGQTFFPEDVRRALALSHPPRILVTTPIHLAACVGSTVEWPEIDLVISATAPLTAELASAVESRLATRVFEIYGCTEAGSIASRRTIDGPYWCWYDTVLARVAEGTTTIDAEFLPSPVPLTDHLEFATDGKFKLIGRNRDLLKVAGKRASLSDLNLKLAAVPGVLDGVFIAPESAAGEVNRLAAVVVAPGLTREQVLKALRQMVDPAFLPRPLVMTTVLPRNAAGKLPRQYLLELLDTGAGLKSSAERPPGSPLDHG
jgi:acyl-coenzyme A synthetase/AMP-(fatty) acid ligase